MDFPPEITTKRKAIKNAELQDLENAAIAKAEVAKAKRDAELAAERGKAELVRAKADAAANKVRSKSLTSQILLVKQLEMFEKLAIGPNNTTILIPFKAMGSEGMQKMILNRQAIERLSSQKDLKSQTKIPNVSTHKQIPTPHTIKKKEISKTDVEKEVESLFKVVRAIKKELKK